MANVYVYSGAAGAGTGADWANAYTTLAAALTAKVAGDSFWVAHNHAETQASAMTMTSPGTITAPCFVYCVNSAGTVPPVSADLRTTASITTTGNNAMSLGGSAYVYGITFACGSGAVAAILSVCSSASCFQVFEACKLQKNGTTAVSAALTFGQNSGVNTKLTLINTTATFGNVGDNIQLNNVVLMWRNTASAIGGSAFPTTLFQTSVRGANAILDGVDLSALASGSTLFGALSSPVNQYMKDCKLGSGVTIATTPSGPYQSEAYLSRADSGATNYRHEKYSYMGTQTVETTIVRAGGASDGTTPLAWKIVTTANAKRVLPFDALPIAIWNNTSGSSVTLTLYGIWGGGAVPNNDDIWMDVEYLGSSASPLGSFATCGPADPIAVAAALGTDSSAWGGSTTAFKMTVTFTPQQKGTVYVYVRAAKASTTLYIDPKLALS